MTYMKNILVICFAVSLVAGCATKSVELSETAALQKYQTVNQLNALLVKAETEGTAYLAPEGYRKAQSVYDEAMSLAIAEKPGANERAQSGVEQLKTAMENAETSRVVLREVLDAREKAINASAPTLYTKEYNKLESGLRDATVEIENGQIEDAKELRAELIKKYSDLELAALMKNTSQLAKQILAEAEAHDADKYAPKTFKLAEEELALALNVLSSGRTQTKKAQSHADMSIYYAKKSMNITDLLIDFDRRDFSAEDAVLWYQDQLELVNKPFGQTLALDKPNYDIVIGIQNKIKDVLGQYADSQNALVSANENIAMLEGRIESMSTQYQQTDASMKKQLAQVKEENRKAQARYNRIQDMFSDDEAYVFRQGNNVLLETHAFNFKVGASEIDSENYGLLEKIMEAIKVFDNPDIIIMGHTDATGGDAVNLQLSIKRAQTVASFLQKIGKYAPDKISYKGFGESRPVASNETVEGRERNRRIEVLIVNK